MAVHPRVRSGTVMSHQRPVSCSVILRGFSQCSAAPPQSKIRGKGRYLMLEELRERVWSDGPWERLRSKEAMFNTAVRSKAAYDKQPRYKAEARYLVKLNTFNASAFPQHIQRLFLPPNVYILLSNGSYPLP